MIGSHYRHGGAKDANYDADYAMLCNELSSYAPGEKRCRETSFCTPGWYRGQPKLTGAAQGGDRFDLAVGIYW